MKVSRRGPQSFRVFLGDNNVDVVARKLNDGGLLVQVSPAASITDAASQHASCIITVEALTAQCGMCHGTA